MLGAEVDGVMPDFPIRCVVRLVHSHADALRVLGIEGVAERLIGRHHACPLALLDLGIPAWRCRRQEPRNGACRERCSELWAGGVQTQPAGRVAGQSRKGGGHGVCVSLDMPV
jgi:hypothetical protein